LSFKEFTFQCRAKAENYQDEMKVKTSITEVVLMDFVKSSRDMITKIDAMKL
jgi:hypothetical protein